MERVEKRRAVSKDKAERRTGRGVEKRRAVSKDKAEKRTRRGWRKEEL